MNVPSGFKTIDDFLSKVKIGKIYKDNDFAEFYKDQATIFASQLRSCDYIFDKKGKYLIFANYEPDTGFLHSSQCFYIKPFKDVSKDEWKLLNKLSSNVKNSELKKVDEENIDIIADDLFNQPNRKIMNFQLENERLNKSNIRYIVFTVISTSLMMLILFVGIFKKNKKVESLILLFYLLTQQQRNPLFSLDFLLQLQILLGADFQNIIYIKETQSRQQQFSTIF